MKKEIIVIPILILSTFFAYTADAQKKKTTAPVAAGSASIQAPSYGPMGIFEKNMLTAANRLYEQGKFNDAYAKYEELRDKYPDNPLSYYGMGSVRFATGNYAMAVDRYKIATELEPGFADAYYWLGNAYYMAGKKNEAASAWNECLKIDPKNENAKKKLGKK